ncbi:MAG: YkgJ family cysteine cluster protein [Cyclobacteriaceae bacterium]
MDSLEEKAKAVELVFNKLDEEISKFQNWSTLHCEFGCGKCCFKPDIEATALEFLPFALSVYKNNQAEEWLSRLSESDSSICLILHPSQSGAGLCSDYTHRGLICRLFGYSARTNKYGKKELVTCQIIKTNQVEKFTEAETKIENGADLPVMNEFYMQLASVDFEMAREFYPINVALRKAIEVVLHYYAYR